MSSKKKQSFCLGLGVLMSPVQSDKSNTSVIHTGQKTANTTSQSSPTARGLSFWQSTVTIHRAQSGEIFHRQSTVCNTYTDIQIHVYTDRHMYIYIYTHKYTWVSAGTNFDSLDVL